MAIQRGDWHALASGKSIRASPMHILGGRILLALESDESESWQELVALPQHPQVNPIINRVRRACGVHDAVFRKCCDLSTVIDPARMPVISAERGESAQVEELPKKRATRKVCAEAANVFAVRVWDTRFGKTYDLPEVVDLAPVHPTVLSAERAEVNLVSVNAHHCASV